MTNMNQKKQENNKKTIRHIIKFLSGQTKSVINDLEKERNVLSKNQQFEKAAEIQVKINAINLVTSKFWTVSFPR